MACLGAGLFAAGLLPCGAEVPSPVPAGPATIRLVAVGDTLVHAPEITAAWNPGTRTYDFRPMFAEIKPLLDQADLATAVLETTLGGPESGYTGYPAFNSPDQIADALQWAGVDVVFTAHNHLLDRGSKGLFRTLDYLDRIGLAHVGSARTPDPAARMVLKEINGVKVALLAYTTMTNGIPVPAAYPWSVNLYDQKRMAADVAQARQAGADIVVCAMHSGVEYQRQPAPAQRAIMDQLVQAGVDIVLGSHPHVIEPVEARTLAGPEGTKRTVFVAYSLGNLLSNQRWRYSDCGLMVSLTIAKEPGRPATVTEAVWRPLWVHKYQINGQVKYRILPVDDRIKTTYAADKLLTAADRQRLAQVWEENLALLGPPRILAAATP